MIIDGVEYSEEQLKMSIYEFYNPIILDQKPFLHDDMTVGEYLAELKYYGENFDKVLNGSCIPLWKQ